MSQKHVSIYVPFIFDFTYSKFQETYNKKNIYIKNNNLNLCVEY